MSIDSFTSRSWVKVVHSYDEKRDLENLMKRMKDEKEDIYKKLKN